MNKRAVLIVGTLGIAAAYFLFQKTARAESYAPTPQPQRVPGGIELIEVPEQPSGGALDLSWLTDWFSGPTQSEPAPSGPTQQLPSYYSEWEDFGTPEADPLSPPDLIATPDPWAGFDWEASQDYAIDFDQAYTAPETGQVAPGYDVEAYRVPIDPDTNLRAFLAMVRTLEAGTSGSRSYSTLIGGGQFYDFSEHPFILNPDLAAIQSGNLPASKAAGAYQFLPQTWREARDALGLMDFSPASQDAAAVFLIQRRGALADVENGNFSTAIVKLGREWASLPGSPYGQTSRTLAQAQAIYENEGGTIA